MVATPYVVGLTGGIACGKSSVSAILRQQGVPVIDADAQARTLTLPGTSAYQAIVNHFGAVSLHKDGTLNRAYLRRRIFSNAKDKAWLEQLLHPLIFQACLTALAALPANTLYAVLDIPLLLESKLAYPVNAVWVVDAEPEQQATRLKNRDALNPKLLKAMLSAQIPRSQRLKQADVLISNNKTLKELQEIVVNLHKKMLRKYAQ